MVLFHLAARIQAEPGFLIGVRSTGYELADAFFSIRWIKRTSHSTASLARIVSTPSQKSHFCGCVMLPTSRIEIDLSSIDPVVTAANNGRNPAPFNRKD